MDNAIYASITRQSGLMKEMEVIANNIANANTTGYRREGVIFSEFMAETGEDSAPLSMAWAHGRLTDLTPGGITGTGGALDFAIEGEGFFQVQTPDGIQLTRAGSFMRSAEGQLVTPDGYPALDQGGAAIVVPNDKIGAGADGTLSTNGQPFAQLGIVQPTPDSQILYAGGTRFSVEGATEPVIEPKVVQGQVENSNVNPVQEISRMVQVQRAYELGQSFIDKEDQRIRNVISALNQ